VRNLADWLVAARERGAWSYGADAEAPTSYRELDLSGRVILVLGGEGGGLRPRVAESCDVLARIPTGGRVGSLNVSVAAAILMFAAGRAD
jgi:23S rRNA (guanosine2251-2'-O)-methyltransferase